MKYLLDTHILLWTIAGSDKLGKDTLKIILNPDNTIYYSTVSPWEVEIKHQKMPELFTLNGDQLIFLCRQAGIENISIRDQHVAELKNVIPSSELFSHKDPFDRMLLAQARAENITLITHDRKFSAYNDPHILMC